MKIRKIVFHSITYGSVLSLLILSSGCVTTEKDIDPMKSDITTLRQQLIKTQQELNTAKQDIQNENEKQLSAMKGDLENIQKNQADSKVAVGKISQDVSIVNNRLDEYQDRMNKLEQKITASEQSITQKLDLAKAENQKRLDALEQKLNTGMTPVTPTEGASTTTLSESSTPTLEIVDPKQLYQTAEQDYLKGHYELSVKEIKDYIQRFPEGAQIAPAHYLLAQNYLGQQKSDDALVELNTFITAYPADDKIPSAMLKRAFIYKQQKKNTEYQDELKALVKKYPLSPEAEQALDELKSVQK